MKLVRFSFLMITLLLCSLAAKAHDFEVGGIFYNITSSTDMTVAVTFKGSSYSSYSDEYSGDVVIPSTVTYNSETYSVVEIDGLTFYQCTSVTSVAIHDGVTSIGSSAFSGCSSLTSITIPDGVTSIGNRAFYGCSGLTSIVIPAGVISIEEYTFYGCSSLASISIPSDVISVGSYAFVGTAWYDNQPDGAIYAGKHVCGYKGSITSVIIEEGTMSICSYAFSGCSSLLSITIPESVTSIGHYAFEGCSSLTSIIIPESVTSIGTSAFEGCSSLASISIPSDVISVGIYAFVGTAWYDNQPDGAIYAGKHVCGYKGSITSVIIEEGTMSICGYAFSGCSSLLSITIPESVTSIGVGAFSECENLTDVNIPQRVTEIGQNVFNKCSSLASIVLPEGLVSIGGWAFYNCSSLVSITIPAGVTSIESYAFSGCENLVAIISKSAIPPTVGRGVYTLVEKNIPIYVPEDAIATYKASQYWSEFSNIRAIVDNYFASGICGDNLTWLLTVEGKLIIDGTGKMEWSISADEAPWARYNERILTVVIESGVTSIKHGAFSNCINMTSASIANSVTSIGSSAFEFCKSLTSITIPSRVATISKNAFLGCSSLTSVTIPIGVRSIEEWAFYACKSLTSITLPEGLTSINGAFYLCSNLKSVSIPNSVTNIGDNSFFECSSLVSITLPDNLAKLGSWAFCNCTSLSSIVIPNGVTSIGYATFQGCKALSSIDLHEGIVSVGDYAFAYCSALNFIVSKAELPPVAEANTFSRVDKTIPVYVPNVTAYKSADYWKEFTNYIALSVPEQEIEIYDSEAEFVSPTFEDYDKVSYHRTFNNTNWQALYVPFEIPVTAEFLADFEVAYINNVHQRDYDDDGVTEQTEVEAFKITKGTLRANYPYLIRAKEAGKKIITVTNTTLYATEENSIDCASVFRTYTFTGTYKRLSSDVLPQSEGYYALSGGKWKPIATGSSLGAFRFYLQVKSRGGDAATKALSIRMRIFDEYGNEEITEVEDIEANLPAEDVVYDLQGRRVEVPGKGVYIVNGKKMVF